MHHFLMLILVFLGHLKRERIEICVSRAEANVIKLGLKKKETLLEKIAEELTETYNPASDTIEIKESYRNMKYKLDEHPQVVEYALEAVERSGLKPIKNLIRGGTDGARLSYMGLPTPNIFTGGHNFHSQKEWISIQDMEKAVETIVNLVQIWAEKSK